MSPSEFRSILRERLPILQQMEESLTNRIPVICTDLSRVGREVTTPKSLQAVGLYIARAAESDWTDSQSLQGTVQSLTALIEFWELIFQRHGKARSIFTAAVDHPYCLVLRSFSTVGHPMEYPGARLVMYVNDQRLDANFAETLTVEATWLNPVSCLHTDDMQLLARLGPTMPSFRVTTANWRAVVNDAIASSGSIIFYIEEDTPGVDYELGRIREHKLEGQTVLVHRGDIAPYVAYPGKYAAVIDIAEFIKPARNKRGPGKLSRFSRRLLRSLANNAITRTSASERLLTMPCKIVDTDPYGNSDQAESETNYLVTGDNADAFVSYVENFPDAILQWNAVSQDMRLRGIQPDRESFNALYRSLRMAFFSAACLGFTSSIAVTLGLLAKVASIVKFDRTENRKRLEQYDLILDIAERFDRLTEHHASIEKIRALRASIHEDPFM